MVEAMWECKQAQRQENELRVFLVYQKNYNNRQNMYGGPRDEKNQSNLKDIKKIESTVRVNCGL